MDAHTYGKVLEKLAQLFRLFAIPAFPPLVVMNS